MSDKDVRNVIKRIVSDVRFVADRPATAENYRQNGSHAERVGTLFFKTVANPTCRDRHDHQVDVKLVAMPIKGRNLGHRPDVYRVSAEVRYFSEYEELILAYALMPGVDKAAFDAVAEDFAEDMHQLIDHEIGHLQREVSWKHHRRPTGHAYQRQGMEQDSNFLQFAGTARRMRDQGRTPSYDDVADRVLVGGAFRSPKWRGRMEKRFEREGLPPFA